MMKKTGALLLSTTLVVGLLSGCSTVMNGTLQKVDIKLVGAKKARCVLSNDDFRYLVNAPASVRIERSSKPLNVDCLAPGGVRESFTIEPRINAETGLNFTNGIVPGVTTDLASGAAYNYPFEVVVDFIYGSEDGVSKAVLHKNNVPQDLSKIWPENTVDEGYVYIPPKSEEKPVVEVAPEEPYKGKDPVTAIEMLHHKMNPMMTKDGHSLVIEPKNDLDVELQPAKSQSEEAKTVLEEKAPANIQYEPRAYENVQMAPIMDEPERPVMPKKVKKIEAPKVESAPAPVAEVIKEEKASPAEAVIEEVQTEKAAAPAAETPMQAPAPDFIEDMEMPQPSQAAPVTEAVKEAVTEMSEELSTTGAEMVDDAVETLNIEGDVE